MVKPFAMDRNFNPLRYMDMEIGSYDGQLNETVFLSLKIACILVNSADTNEASILGLHRLLMPLFHTDHKSPRINKY